MNRKEFLSKLGIGAAFVLTSTCLGSCGKDDNNPTLVTPPTTNVDFTLNLSEPANANALNSPGYIIKDKVVIARDTNNNYVAATQICSHEGNAQIIYLQNEWFCTAHDARFSLNGQGLNSNGANGLKIYNTELTGDTLRIFS